MAPLSGNRTRATELGNSSSAMESEKESPGDAQGFFDLEAEEDHSSEPDESSEPSEPSEHLFRVCFEDIPKPKSTMAFPQFSRLPIELRAHIWAKFNPQLTMPHRIFQFQCSAYVWGSGWFVTNGTTLATMTRATRDMLATHRESRQLALSKFPDTIEIFDIHAVVRFDKEKDIIMFDTATSDHIYYSDFLPYPEISNFPAFADQVVNLAIEVPVAEYPSLVSNPAAFSAAPSFLAAFKNLKVLYHWTEDQFMPESKMLWCATDHAKCFRFSEAASGLAPILFVWHDSDSRCDGEGACRFITDEFSGASDSHEDPQSPQESNSGNGSPDRGNAVRQVQRRPMRMYGLSNEDHYENLFAYKASDNTWPVGFLSDFSDGEDELGSDSTNLETDEYESDGIDDDSIPEIQTEDEDEAGSGIEDDTLAMELMGSTEQPQGATTGFSPIEISDDDEDEDSGDGQRTSDASDPDYTGGYRARRRARLRAALVDSDDQDETDGPEVAGTMLNRGIKRSRVVDSEESDGDEQTRSAQAKRKSRRMMPNDDTDSSGDSDDSDIMEVAHRARSAATRSDPVVVGGSEDEDEDGSAEEDSEEEANDYTAAGSFDDDDDENDGSEEESDGGHVGRHGVVLELVEEYYEDDEGDDDDGASYYG